MKMATALLSSYFPSLSKTQDKSLKILRTGRAFKIIKAFFINFKELSLKQINVTSLASGIQTSNTKI